MHPVNDSAMGAIRARRATGAIFFAVFGGAWLESWAFGSKRSPMFAMAIGVLALVLTLAAYFTYRRHAAALAAEPDTPERQRARRIFHIVNSGQWVAILLLASLLAFFGLNRWIAPMVMGVIGLHFFPLAAVFKNPPHYVTGAAFLALAIIYPQVAPGGPTDAVGFLGAGLILWASAAWAIRRHE